METRVSSIAVGVVVFLIITAGLCAGWRLARLVPSAHLTKESCEVIRLGVNMLTLLTSLLLGLLVASAKNGFDRTETELRLYSSQIIQLGDSLASFGPEAQPALEILQTYTRRTIAYHWQTDAAPEDVEDPAAGRMLLSLQDAIMALPGATPRQDMLRRQAWDRFNTMQTTRWRIIMQSKNTFHPFLLWSLVIWITCIFASFGLQAPRNRTVFVIPVVCAAGIGCAMFLAHEMEEPFGGIIDVSGDSLRAALRHIAP